MWSMLPLVLFVNAEIAAQRGEVTRPRTHSSAVVMLSAQPRQPDLVSAHYAP